MSTTRFRRPPGEVRDAVRSTLQARPSGASVGEIVAGVRELIGEVSGSSIRSYLRLNTPQSFARPRRGYYRLTVNEIHPDGACSAKRRFRTEVIGRAKVIHGDCMEWLKQRERNSIHAVVTDPPYGLVEYSSKEQEKLRNGTGGVWRIPPSFDGASRSPLPRFTVLSPDDLRALSEFFSRWARLPDAGAGAGGECGGCDQSVALACRCRCARRNGPRAKRRDRPARDDHARRRPSEGRTRRILGCQRDAPLDVGALARVSQAAGGAGSGQPAQVADRWIQATLSPASLRGRHPLVADPEGGAGSGAASEPEAAGIPPALVRGVLPLGEGVVLDPFCGAGSTLAAAEAVGYRSVGVESDSEYFNMACQGIPRLRNYQREQADMFQTL